MKTKNNRTVLEAVLNGLFWDAGLGDRASPYIQHLGRMWYLR